MNDLCRYHLRYLLALVVLTISAARGSTQETDVEFAEFDNRREGVVTDQFTDTQIQLVGFVYDMDRFEATEVEALYVHFFKPDNNPIVVRGYDIFRSKRYVMESKPHDWPEEAFSVFGPWPTADRLLPLNMSSSDLGVIVFANAERDNELPARIVPSGVSVDRTPKVADQLVMTFYTLGEVARYYLNVRDAESGELIAEDWSEDTVEANEVFDIRLDLGGWEDGWKNVTINVRTAVGEIQRPEFDFFYKALP